MIQAKCIHKFRDEQDRIYGYRLVDINGQTQDVTADNLKNAIRNGKISIVNLSLTSDNRLVDTSGKQLQSTALGKPPVNKNGLTLDMVLAQVKKLGYNAEYMRTERTIKTNKGIVTRVNAKCVGIDANYKLRYKFYYVLLTADTLRKTYSQNDADAGQNVIPADDELMLLFAELRDGMLIPIKMGDKMFTTATIDGLQNALEMMNSLFAPLR